MNYLAHAYLSFDDPDVLLGNLISDFVKGKRQYEYPAPVYRGIRLHREIDRFTDQHDATKRVKDFFRKDYGLYASAFADIVYDYFLANDTGVFPAEAHLMDFSNRTYEHLAGRRQYFPDIFNRVFDSMREHNWLYHYRYEWGIGRSFQGLVRRAAYLDESERAFDIFLNNQDAFRELYEAFFPELLKHTRSQFQCLMKDE